jgi:hypothetical protein
MKAAQTNTVLAWSAVASSDEVIATIEFDIVLIH